MNESDPDERPSLYLAPLLPLRGLVITLACTSSARLNFFHQPALTAFLRFLVGSPADYDTLIRLDAPESGRVRYRKGDYYRFLLIGLAGSESLLDRLLQQLALLPGSAPKLGDELPFRDNWKLVAVQDMFSGEPVQSLQQLAEYDGATLQAEAALWADCRQLDWQWVAPARVLKDKAERTDATGRELAGDARFVRDAADVPGELLLVRAWNALAALLRARGQDSAPLQDVPVAHVLEAHLFWLDVQYRGADRHSKDMGGVSGRVRLMLPEGLPAAWWAIVVLGQYLGVGQRTAFGWGRYVLQAMDGGQSYRRVFPANSLLVLAQEEDNLSRAWRHVLGGRDIPADVADEEDVAQWYGAEEEGQADSLADHFPLERLQTGLERLLWGRYEFPDLRGYLIPKNNGGVRPLAIPPVFDRVLQRALQQVLNESLEPLMAQDSHGYRAGRSRITASQAIQAAWRAGYRWVYEGDVRDFFDSVDWQRLEERLRAIFHNDPAVAAMLGWMRAAVVFQGERIERHQGLPQGSPLSPVLANLMLDDFDSDMEAAGFRMIRYADDFVVLCKSPQEAQAAQVRAAASLQEHGLDLHPDKSQVTAMEDGFRYLGYLFVNDLALDVGGSPRQAVDAAQASPPPQSWLAQLGERVAQRAQNEQSLRGLVERIRQQQAVTVGERERSGSFVTVSGDPAVLSTLGGQLNVYRKDTCVLRLPWNSIEAVLLLGNHQMTTQAMQAALEHDIPVHLASGFGDYRGCISHNRNSQHQATWMQQVLAFQDEDKALYCAREVLAARLRHMKEVLRQRKQAASLPVLDKAIRVLGQVQSLEELLGYEGSATREYYGKLAEILPPAFNFSGRNRRPPRDPFNVMLSLGYTQLYMLVESVLHTKGLLPWQGFYHQPRGRHAALASDLMEPFRHFVERSALSMVLHHEIKEEDFSSSPAGACLMEDKARRKYIALLLHSWEVKVTARGQAEPKTWLEHMQEQAQSLKNFIRRGEPFHAFRLR